MQSTYRTLSLQHLSAVASIAIGETFLVRRNQPEFTERKLKSADVPAEVKRYRKALANARKQLEKVRKAIPKDASSDVSAFIETHLLMLDDSVLSQGPIDILKTKKVSAETALEGQRKELQRIFEAMEDPYIATRMDDVNHVIDQIMNVLVEKQRPEKSSDTPAAHEWAGKIVVADDLTPADTILMQHDGVLGFVTETGGQLSHTAILARSLGIPAIVGIHNIRNYLKPGEELVLNGDIGMLLAEPDKAMVAAFVKQQRLHKEQQRELNKLINTPLVCADGTAISLRANIEIAEDLKSVRRVNAEGVGLYRTEFLYMNRDDIPAEDEHYRVYLKVAKALKGAPLTIRTADLGADKEVDTENSGPLAHNPAMGLRGTRLALSDTSLIIPQIAAILRVSARAPVNMMFPMLTNLHEIEQCTELVSDVKQQLVKRRVKFNDEIMIGGMVEVPAAAIAAEQFASKLDFLSIGTNDLIQYTLAIDRIDDQVDYLYDPLHPAVLQLIKHTIDAGNKAGIPVAMCGEMAGDPRFVRLLLGLGLREFSMHPNSLLEVKRALLGADSKQLQRQGQALLKSTSSDAKLKLLEKINRERALPVQ